MFHKMADTATNARRGARICGLALELSTQTRGSMRTFVDLHPIQVHKHEEKLPQMFHNNASKLGELKKPKALLHALGLVNSRMRRDSNSR